MNHIYNDITSGHLSSFNTRHDAPRSAADASVVIHWPIDRGSLGLSQQQQDAIEPLVASDAFNDYGIFALPITAPDLAGPTATSLELAQAIVVRSQQVEWTELSMLLTGSRGGEFGSDTQRVMQVLRRGLVPPPETIYVPASRSIRSNSDSRDWDFSGSGVIERLHRILNPEFDEAPLRRQALAIRADLRILLNEPELVFEVPHDLSTVNVQLGADFFPLEALGTGTEHAILILAAAHVYPDHLLCLEEPDAHMHPILQRRLMQMLRPSRLAGSVVATHSAHIVDVASDDVLGVRREAGRSVLTRIAYPQMFEELRRLGYRASDILQANSLVWVEGPSDRIYLLHWLAVVAPDLKEGIDFSILFYGGALLARLSAMPEGPDDPSLVDLWRINQRMWIMMDSDMGTRASLKPAVTRLTGEIAATGRGGTWITKGYTVECYVPADVLLASVREVHPSVERLGSIDPSSDPLRSMPMTNGNQLESPDKVAISAAVARRPAIIDVLDLEERLLALVRFLREEAPPPVVPS